MTSSIRRTQKIPQLSAARAVACLGIVVLHTVFAANEYFSAGISTSDNLVSRMVENNMMWAVPVFLMVTGALQLDPGHALTLRKLYGRYILRILLALIGCCILFRLFDMIMDGEDVSAAGLIQAFAELITARSWGHLWYLYLLIGLYILLPFARMIVRAASEKELLYLCGAYLLFVSLIPMIESFGIPIGFYISESIIYPLYLFLGFMIKTERLRISMGKGIVLLACSTAVILIMDMMKYSSGMNLPDKLFGYSSPVVIVQAIAVFAVICRCRLPRGGGSRILKVIDECSFGVYLIHMVFIRLLFRYMQWNPYSGISFLNIAAVVVGVFLISLIIVRILRMVPGIRWVL